MIDLNLYIFHACILQDTYILLYMIIIFQTSFNYDYNIYKLTKKTINILNFDKISRFKKITTKFKIYIYICNFKFYISYNIIYYKTN